MHIFVLTTLLVGVCWSAPTPDRIIHERRHVTPAGWAKRARLAGDQLLHLRIGLSQQSLERGPEVLDSVSNPASKSYGAYFSASQVAEMFRPSDDTISAVMKWLADSGIGDERASLSKGKNWITLKVTSEEAEKLLQAEYFVYEHDTGQAHVACESYSVPHRLQEHIDIITPTVHFDAQIRPGRGAASKRSAPNSSTVMGNADTKSTINSNFPTKGPKLMPAEVGNDLSNCSQQTVPNCLRTLYSIPEGDGAHPNNSFGIVEYTPQSYVPSDLNMFFSNFSPALVGQVPTMNSIDGGALYTLLEESDYNEESDLDLAYAMTLVYPLNVTLFQVGDSVEGASFNTFLDAIDGSYCTYDGGDDPSKDPVYPDPASKRPEAYEGPENCGGFPPSYVISTSYAFDEPEVTPRYATRQCNEYMKLGLQGVTVLYASGDYGVAGSVYRCIVPGGGYTRDGTGLFNPSFPGTCPYVTAVGATQVVQSANIVETMANGSQPEQACETQIYSGGGFSNVFAMPDYQASTVQGWFSNHPPPYGSDKFNNSQQSRAVPDISANGANYVLAVDGEWTMVYGTSASTPVVGSIIALINEQRLRQGKSSVGFINPVLYANPQVLNDITQGSNPGCGTKGFQAVEGWDPVTGLGTPNYPKMLELFLSLP